MQPIEEVDAKITEGGEMIPKRSYSLRSGGRGDAFKFSSKWNIFSRVNFFLELEN